MKSADYGFVSVCIVETLWLLGCIDEFGRSVTHAICRQFEGDLVVPAGALSVVSVPAFLPTPAVVARQLGVAQLRV